MGWDYPLLNFNPVFPGLEDIIIIIIIIIITTIIIDWHNPKKAESFLFEK